MEKKDEKPAAAPAEKKEEKPAEKSDEKQKPKKEAKPVEIAIRVKPAPDADWPDPEVVGVKADKVQIPNITMPGALTKGHFLLL